LPEKGRKEGKRRKKEAPKLDSGPVGNARSGRRNEKGGERTEPEFVWSRIHLVGRLEIVNADRCDLAEG